MNPDEFEVKPASCSQPDLRRAGLSGGGGSAFPTCLSVVSMAGDQSSCGTPSPPDHDSNLAFVLFLLSRITDPWTTICHQDLGLPGREDLPLVELVRTLPHSSVFEDWPLSF